MAECRNGGMSKCRHVTVDFPNSAPAKCIDAVRGLFNQLNVPFSEEKMVGPTTKLEFWGIMLDSNLMQASLPSEKLDRIRGIVSDFLSTDAKSVSKSELLSLLGHFNFTMCIIPQGRTFIARLLDLAKTVSNLHDMIRIDEGCRTSHSAPIYVSGRCC